MSEQDDVLMPAMLAASLHEVKNMLGELTLSLDALQQQCPQQGESIGEMRFVTRQVSDRLVQVLLLYKNDAGALRPNIEAVPPADVLEEMLVETRSLAGDRLVVTLEGEEAPPYAYFDRYLCEMALLNAIHNALRFAHSRIVIGAGKIGNALCFTVEDDGPGFVPDILQRAITPGGHSRDGGTGLGLYFADRVARLHCNNTGECGRIQLDNNSVLGGARFLLILP